MTLFQNGIDVSRYQGSVDWKAVANAGKQFAIVRLGSSNSSGLYVDPYFLQNVNGAHAAGLRVGAYYYTYARTQNAVINELSLFLDVLEGLQLEYPVFVDVEDSSLTSLGRSQLTSLVQYAMDILYQRRWYAGWYSYTNFINNYLNPAQLAAYPLWLADYRSQPGYTGTYDMWQYSSTGAVGGIAGACDLNYCYTDFLPLLSPKLHPQSPLIATSASCYSANLQSPIRISKPAAEICSQPENALCSMNSNACFAASNTIQNGEREFLFH